nr:response regulator [Chloroflexota bacterium]
MKSNSLTIRDVAQYCRVSQFTVLKWIQQGKLEACQTADGQLFVPFQEFQAFLRIHGMPIDGFYFRVKGNPKRILVISAEDEITESLVRTLCQMSVVLQVFSVRNWSEARCQIVALKPDLIILDLRHLGLDGTEMRHWLRQNPARAHIKLLAIVDADESEDLQRLSEKGVDEVVQQPLDAATLQKKIHALLMDT